MATVYVAASGGSDSNTYTQAQSTTTPWATLLKALNTALRFDVIELRGGTFNEFFFKNSRDDVTIQNYPGEAVIFQTTSSRQRIMGFENCRGILLRKNPSGGSFTIKHSDTTRPAWGAGVGNGIEIIYASGSSNTFGMTGSTLPQVTIDGIVMTNILNRDVYSYMTGSIIRNCDIGTGSGIVIRGNPGMSCPGTIIEDNEIHHMDRLFQDVRDGSTTDDAGAVGVVCWLADGVIVRRNEIHNNSAFSQQFGLDGGAVETYRAANNLFYDNECYDNEGTFETGTNGAGGTASTGNKFYKNYVHGRMNFNGASPTFLMRANPNGEISNNTIVVDGGGSGGTTASDVFRIQHLTGGFGGSVTGLAVRNNVIVNTNTAHKFLEMTSNVQSMSPPMNWNYNLLYGSGTVDTGTATYTLGQIATARSATTYFDNDIWGSDPLLNGDTLQAGSPAINTGVVIAGITDGYVGAAPDMGATEFATPAEDEIANPTAAFGAAAAVAPVVIVSGVVGLTVYMG